MPARGEMPPASLWVGTAPLPPAHGCKVEREIMPPRLPPRRRLSDDGDERRGDGINKMPNRGIITSSFSFSRTDQLGRNRDDLESLGERCH